MKTHICEYLTVTGPKELAFFRGCICLAVALFFPHNHLLTFCLSSFIIEPRGGDDENRPPAIWIFGSGLVGLSLGFPN